MTSFHEMTMLPAKMREELDGKYHIKSLKAQTKLVSNRRDTVKYLYGLGCSPQSEQFDDAIETVFMEHKHGNSLCISSQAGCKMGCAFCASGLAGFRRNLTPSEMLLQLYETERDGKKIDSIVIMGIGEPLDNFENVVKFLRILESPHGHNMSLRHVSLSTCGPADKIDELATLKMGLTLSVSLHAVTDEERSAIMPINRKFGLDRLLDSCSEYFAATKRRISFEFALISGVNDSELHARELAKLLRKLPRHSYHVNLITVNEIKGLIHRRSTAAKDFAAVLEKMGVTVTVRRTMGADINAACGQLRNSTGVALFLRK
jgi:23S rRNA (adenine2503-C2)-methyltransferase